MRICLFTGSFLPRVGGVEIALDRLAREFLALGQEVTVLAKTSKEDLAIPRFPYRVVYYPRHRSSIWLGTLYRALMREQTSCPFGVLHAHMTYPAGYAAVRMKGRLKAPVVVASHGDVLPGRRYRRRGWTQRRIIWALNNADALTAVCQDVKGIMDGLMGAPDRTVLIPNGIDLPDGRPAPTPARFAPLDARPFLLSLGRLHHYKGLDVLLEAMSLLARQGAEPPELVIAGDGREGEPLRRQATHLGLGGRVRLIGGVAGQEKDWLLRNCLFLVHPSRTEGGRPLSIMEAMAYGKAVIATRVGGNVDLVVSAWDPGDRPPTGILVPSEDANMLAQAIGALIRSPQRDPMGAAGKAAAAGMNWRPIAERYLELYRRLAG